MTIYTVAQIKNLCSHSSCLSSSHISQPIPDQVSYFLSPIYILNLISSNATTKVQAAITSHLDYCCSLLDDSPASTLTSLFLLKHKSNISQTFQWFSSSLRTKLKVLIMTFKGLHNLFPTYSFDFTVLICLQGYWLSVSPITHQTCFHHSNFILPIASTFKVLP